ncbi:bactofilin family protein [Magnetospirillum fulvum]|uniref:Protein CcmA, bactofilin family n=1 Tax=Magnetospirillum fulvum TaxID=1082 RepID=A0A1H6GV46_MAGFU|nr:polymer-forming cytoskeletal protein [Magnetospirillum fulvum]SEH27329.1 protein CcmA, bactofilin family [Magnetospirillum fulvum]
MLSRFGKGGNGSSPRKAASGQTLSLIGADVRIVGNISTEGEIQIDGQLEGDIACRHLLIGETGRITGEVTAETTRVHGEVTGKITAGAVVIARAGRIAGDIIHDSIEIEAGARLEGRLIRKSAQTGAESTPALATATEPARLAPPRKEKDKDKAADGDLSPAPGAA